MPTIILTALVSLGSTLPAAGGASLPAPSLPGSSFVPSTAPLALSPRVALGAAAPGSASVEACRATCRDSALGPLLSKPQPGDVVISEFMSNPAAVSDSQGEWIELRNTLPWRLDMEGLVISDADGDLFGLSNGGAGILIGPGATLVLGNNPDPATNGGVEIDMAYTGFVLANGEDEIYVHTRAGVLLDAVEYSAAGAWPLTPGCSASLDPGSSDPLSNDDPGNWCASSAPLPGGDSGSPGAPNAPCQ
ncbi:MAG: hypothetical protein CMJ84_08520 [Planctomycetes bacterium]|jgi:hypothetical protein|nr:hypothetical protein [Planctomycetota bacterium]MDP6410109.1 lamin tail domain-containing protein [Planctomycetota bacterium]